MWIITDLDDATATPDTGNAGVVEVPLELDRRGVVLVFCEDRIQIWSPTSLAVSRMSMKPWV